MNKIIIFIITLLILLVINHHLYKENFYNEDKNIFNSKFDKILYINLIHRKDRNEQILNEFKKMNIDKNKIHRIDAVHEKYNGHIGCAKSHIKALKYAKDNNYKRIFVFEDDFIFTLPKNDTNKRLTKFLKDYEGKWDVVQLTSVYKSFRNNKPPDEIDNVNLINKASTSSSYIINHHFYDKLIETLNESLEKMNHEMIEFHKQNNNIKKKKKTTNYALDQYWNPLQKKSNWYLFYPYLGKQGGEAGKSSIMSNNLEGFISNNNIRLYNLRI